MGKVLYFDKNDEIIDWSSANSIEFGFWDTVFRELNVPYTFIITENTNYLPNYGENIVVLLKSDEFYSPIKYITKVKAVFRNYYSLKYSEFDNCFFLPLPFLGQELVITHIPINQRKVDVFFAGQVKHSRKQFIEIVNKFKALNSDINIEVVQNDSFLSGKNLQDYYDKLANSKIALCPYGASIETYRHFEALRLGCICITQSLPDIWYFQNSPYITINSWMEINSVVKSILSSNRSLIVRSNNGFSFWNDNLSPEAIRKYIYLKLTI